MLDDVFIHQMKFPVFIISDLIDLSRFECQKHIFNSCIKKNVQF